MISEHDVERLPNIIKSVCPGCGCVPVMFSVDWVYTRTRTYRTLHCACGDEVTRTVYEYHRDEEANYASDTAGDCFD
jgi:formate dehydrogenase maturation protein FdhE